MLGGGGRSLDVISVSIVPATALESRETLPAAPAGASAGYVAPSEGDDIASAQASPDRQPEVTPPQPAQTTEALAESAAAPPEPAPASAADEAPVATDMTPPAEAPKVALAEPTPPPPEKIETPNEPHPPEPQEKAPDEISDAPSPDARQAGGLAARGIAPDLPPAPAAAAAIAGEVHAYGLAIQSALLAVDQSGVRARKAVSRTRGTTLVRFAITPDGSLAHAEIATSSGQRELDEAAIELVRLIAFPRPPPGLSDAQRTYVAPIVFRP